MAWNEMVCIDRELLHLQDLWPQCFGHKPNDIIEHNASTTKVLECRMFGILINATITG